MGRYERSSEPMNLRDIGRIELVLRSAAGRLMRQWEHEDWSGMADTAERLEGCASELRKFLPESTRTTPRFGYASRAEDAAGTLWVALRDLSDQVEMAESVGICLPDRVAALIARDALAEYNDVVIDPPQLEETPDGGLRQKPTSGTR